MVKQELGKFTDFFSVDEIEYSKKAAEELRNADWAKKILSDKKISTALKVEKNMDRTYDEFSSIKSALFEIRFADGLHKIGFNAEYEAATGVGRSTVDFKVPYDSSIWLIELTSTRESDTVKEATKTKDEFYSYLSITNNRTNSPEILELIKLQKVICNKVHKQGLPHKFPEISDNIYNVILVDIRSINAGIIDHFDCHIITHGSSSLANVAEGVYCRGFIDNTGKLDHIKGIFEQNHPDPNSKIIRERIHFICFVKEQEYNENELINKMKVFENPHFFQDHETALKLWPFKFEAP